MEGMGAGMELMVMNCVWRRDASMVMLARERALPVVAAFSDVDGHTCVGAEEGEFPELEGNVGCRARGEAKVVGEAVSWAYVAVGSVGSTLVAGGPRR
jgi:hypothetical protein